MKEEKATFAMGCFWHPQRVFDKIKGVLETEVGFMGGDESFTNLSYNQVCTGITRHAEVVQITFNQKVVSYENLLKTFWKKHNPTTMNRQGPDIGEQYQSAIFYNSETQKETALKLIVHSSGNKILILRSYSRFPHQLNPILMQCPYDLLP